MKLKKLAVNGLTVLKSEIDLSGASGLIAIVGDNGAGKTSMMACFMLASLYRTLGDYPGSLHSLANRRDASLRLDFEHDGHEWTVHNVIDCGTAKTPGNEKPTLYRDGVALCPARTADFDEAVAQHFPSLAMVRTSIYSAQERKGSFPDMTVPQRKELFANMLGLAPMQLKSERAGTARKAAEALIGEVELKITTARRKVDARAALLAEVETATTAAQTARAAHEANVASLNTARAAASDARGALKALSEARENATKRHTDAVTAAQRADKEAASYEAQAADAERAQGRIGDLEAKVKRHAELSAETAVLRERYATAAKAKRGAAEKVAESAATEARLNAQIGDLARLEAGITKRQEDAQRAKADAAGVDADRATLATLEAEHKDAVEAAEAARKASSDAASQHDKETALASQAVTSARQTVTSTQQGVRAAQAQVDTFAAQVRNLEAVPCKGRVGEMQATAADGGFTADCGACRFLTEARGSDLRLVAAKERLTQEEEALRVAQGDLAAAQAAAQALASPERLAALGDLKRKATEAATKTAAALDRVTALRSKIAGKMASETKAAQIEAEIAGTRARVEALPRLRLELDELLSARPALEEVERAAKAEEAALLSKGVAAKTELEGLASAAADLAAARRIVDAAAGYTEAGQQARERAETSRQLADAIFGTLPPEPSEAIEAARVAVEAELDASKRATESEATLRAAESALDRKRGALDQMGDPGAEMQALEARKAELATKAAGFALIEAALGRNGIQALEIDAAGPEVNELANEILGSVLDGNFTIQLATVRPAEKGKAQKEVFEVNVLDARNGQYRPLTGFSGGEKVLINEALMLAIAIFNARRTGTAMRTLFRDECDGALSVEKARQYPALLRAAMRVGGFDSVYFITHRPDAAAQADFQLRMVKGQGTIV